MTQSNSQNEPYINGPLGTVYIELLFMSFSAPFIFWTTVLPSFIFHVENYGYIRFISLFINATRKTRSIALSRSFFFK